VTREPHPNSPGRDPLASRNLGDPPLAEVYPLRRGGRAVPDRSRAPEIGAACHDTRKVSAPFTETEELRSGVEFGSTRGNTERQKTGPGARRRSAREPWCGHPTGPPWAALVMDRTFQVELRDTSAAGHAELAALVRRYGGDAGGAGTTLTVRAPTHGAAESIFHALEGDPRVISNAERASAEAQERLTKHRAEQEAARKADREAQLEAQNAELQARIADLERR
jgi:hypothetical protein